MVFGKEVQLRLPSSWLHPAVTVSSSRATRDPSRSPDREGKTCEQWREESSGV